MTATRLEAVAMPDRVPGADLRHAAAVVRMCLAEAGYHDAEVAAPAGRYLTVETCGAMCDGCPNDGRDDGCPPPTHVVDRALALAALGVELGRTGYRP